MTTTRSNKSLDLASNEVSNTSTATVTKPVTANVGSKKTGSKRKKDDPTGQFLQTMKKQIELARYELEVDPYRGIFDSSENCFYKSCFHIFKDLVPSSEITSEDECYGIACPCVSSWIKDERQKLEAIAQRKNKRRKNIVPRSLKMTSKQQKTSEDPVDVNDNSAPVEVKTNEVEIIEVQQNPNGTLNNNFIPVKRNPHVNYSCACDANPYCIASFGGVMDDYLQDRIKDRLQQMKKESLPKCDDMIPTNLSPKDVYDDVFAEHLIPFTSDPVVLSNTTYNTSGKELRKQSVIDVETIVNHLKTVLEIPDAEVKQRLAALKKWHRKRIYPGNIRKVSDNKFVFCRPVGISNLGATCYLNSQLQCLVANLAFMQGVLRWTNDDSNHAQMNLVISSLQSLLAHMVHGAQSIVSTVEFSSALGIENDEMQDPNEFARLLFDRMHESFQQSSPFLKTLLPSLFQGVFEYETKCTECQNVSTRQENFMDLNLPMMGDDVPSSLKDFTIEQLLESYLQIEMLDGDNKYHCCRCDKRTSAERRVTFSKLPPVLNIQLARYVFDLKTFRKKKLMDRILLPRTLDIGKGDGQSHTYILCAVQNHKGSSAYSGHYVAEVMDWTTGVWFEFDDEKVSKQDKGPLSSYYPKQETGQRPKEGTSDAYNLFYVELAFLQKTAKQDSMDLTVDTTSVVRQVSDELERRFNLEKEIQDRNEKILHRLTCRRTGILKFLLNEKLSVDNELYWVNGLVFQKFMSCRDPMDDQFLRPNQSEFPILCSNRSICKHAKGLHPRDFRAGKLLSKAQFNILCDLLYAERDKARSEEGREISNAPIFDHAVISKENVYCHECVNEYRSELASKFEVASRLVKVYIELDPENSSPIDTTMYAVPKSFVTALRKFAMKMFKSFSNMEIGSSTRCPLSGIDYFEVSEWSPLSKEDIDPQVTTVISCPHGNCNFKNKRFIQLISPSLWLDICNFFPDASPIVVNQGSIEPCAECENDMSRKISTASDLFAWATNVSKTISSATKTDHVHKDVELHEFRVVHHKDIEVVHEIVDLLLKAKKRGSESLATGAKLKSQILNILYRNIDINSQDAPMNVRKQFSFSCEKHLLPVASVESLSNLITSIPTDVWLIYPEHYDAIHSSLLELEKVLFGDDIIPEPFSALNPILTIQGLSSGSRPNPYSLKDMISSISQKSKINVSWKLEMCKDKRCYDEYLSKIASIKMTNSMELNSNRKANKSNDHGPDVVIVDDDSVIEDSNALLIEVHEFDGSKGVDRCLSVIEMEMCDKDNNSSVRRSRRNNDRSKKVFSFHESKTSNLAQIRLRIYEKSENKRISNHQLFVFGFTDDSKGFHIELPSKWNERSIESILSDLPVNVMTGSKLQLILNSRSSGEQIELCEEEHGECDDSMFDMLLQLATGYESPQVVKRGKRRREERGFSGTFLQSSFSIPSVSEQNQNVLGDESTTENKQNRDNHLIDLTCLTQDELEDKEESLADVSQVNPENRDQKTLENVSSSFAGTGFASVYASLYDCNIDSLETLCPLEQKEGGNINIPPVPNWSNDIDKGFKERIHDIEKLRSSTPAEKGDEHLIYFHLRHDRILRNFYRNLVNQELHDLSNTSLPMTRREMDIILFYIFQKKSAKECREYLIPYRTENALRQAFRVVKQQNFDDKTYAIYNKHVKQYIEELETKERTIQLIDSVASQG